MKSKPYGIFDIVDNKIPISCVRKSLDRLISSIEEGRQGHKDDVWSWEEVLNSIKCYILIMKQELK